MTEVTFHVKQRHCNFCNITQPITNFPVKWKGDKPSYGRCQICTLKYDHARRRKKGIPVRVYIPPTAPIVSCNKSYEAILMRLMANRPMESRRIHDKICKECNAPFKGYNRSVFCNSKCLHKHHNRVSRLKQKAAKRAATTESVNPTVVFERHNWHCVYCAIHTPQSLRGKHKDNSPELDHIIPLSKGGHHSYTNTQLLCRRCNNIKSNTYECN